MLLLCAQFCLGVLGAAVAYVFWAQSYWARRGVPHTRPVPFLGNLWDSARGLRTAGEVLGEIYRRFEKQPYVGTYNLLRPVLIVKDPSLVKDVLITNFSSFPINEVVYPAGKDELLSENPFAADAARWKELRARMTQAFTPARVKMAFGEITTSARALTAFVASVSPGQSVDVCQLCRRLTAHTSTRVLFGIESHSLEIGKSPGVFYDKGFEIFNGGFISHLRFLVFFNCPDLLPLVGYNLVSSKTVDFFRDLIRNCVEFREKEGITRDDFIHNAGKQVLINGKIDEAALRAVTGQVLTTFVETFETSALTLANALLLLAVHPHYQERLRDELRAAFPAAAGQDAPLEHDKLLGLNYLDQVVKEVLRFIPGLEVVRRKCEKTITLQPQHGKDLTVAPGTLVYIDVLSLHHDPAYFSHPDEFWPDHFSEEESESRPKSVYLPFGDGPRMCPGMRYGNLLVKVMLAAMLLRFRLTPGPEQVLPPQRDPASHFLGLKGGVWLRFEPLSR